MGQTPARALIPPCKEGEDPMTDPTHDQVQDRPPWRLVLDEGERLEVRPAAAGLPMVTLVLPALRAADLGQVSDAYTRMAAIFTDVSQVSGIESSLARALTDAFAVARGTMLLPARPQLSRPSLPRRPTPPSTPPAADWCVRVCPHSRRAADG